MSFVSNLVYLSGSALAFTMTAAPALAEEAQGIAKPWQLDFQEAATPVMQRLADLHMGLTIGAAVISLFVLGLLIYVCLRFSEKNNPVPSKTTHNTLVEIIWTAIPIAILVAIAIPSIRLHYFMDEATDAEMTLKVTGYQWYWNYNYPDNGDFSFDSYMVKDEDLKPGQPRLLAVDNEVVVPVDTTIRVLMSGGDVIHSWAMPAFGVKTDCVPGRSNETWFRAEKTGTFYGQCSELCGVGHGFMPIQVRVVSKEEFAAWSKQAADQFARYGTIRPELASQNAATSSPSSHSALQ